MNIAWNRGAGFLPTSTLNLRLIHWKDERNCGNEELTDTVKIGAIQGFFKDEDN